MTSPCLEASAAPEPPPTSAPEQGQQASEEGLLLSPHRATEAEEVMEEVEHEKKSLGGASAMTSAAIALKAPVDVVHRRQSSERIDWEAMGSPGRIPASSIHGSKGGSGVDTPLATSPKAKSKRNDNASREPPSTPVDLIKARQSLRSVGESSTIGGEESLLGRLARVASLPPSYLRPCCFLLPPQLLSILPPAANGPQVLYHHATLPHRTTRAAAYPR